MGELIHLVCLSPALTRPGVNCYLQGDRRQGFATTTEYFQYILKQDWQQLLQQPNSVFGYYDAQNKYAAFKALQALIPDLIDKNYDHHKFKLICDDLGLANLIVRSREDLTVVGVVDLEWSYIGPAQLFGSAPWWLLQDRPVNSAWDCTADGELPEIAERYFKYLDIFIRVLEEEETRIHGNEDKELSSLVKWSRECGAMWLHMLISSGFNDQHSFPFVQLKRHLGESRWAEYERRCNINADDLDAFAARKVSQLEGYDEALEKMEEEKGAMDSWRMTSRDEGGIYCQTSTGE